MSEAIGNLLQRNILPSAVELLKATESFFEGAATQKNVKALTKMAREKRARFSEGFRKTLARKLGCSSAASAGSEEQQKRLRKWQGYPLFLSFPFLSFPFLSFLFLFLSLPLPFPLSLFFLSTQTISPNAHQPSRTIRRRRQKKLVFKKDVGQWESNSRRAAFHDRLTLFSNPFCRE